MESIIIPQEKRRRRPKVSCTLCRRRKIRCNRESPCSNCVRSRVGACVYEASSPAVVHFGSGITPESSDGLGVGPSNSSSVSSKSLSESSETDLRTRIRQLEDQLASASIKPSEVQGDVHLETTSCPLTGPFHLHYRRELDQSEPVAQGLSLKGRLFGQSHWSVSIAFLLRDFMKMLEPRMRDMSDALNGMGKCKVLARRIKTQRAPSWPPSLTSELPSREVTDALVNQYLQTTESLYRILHIPSFRRKYEKLWEPGTDQSRDLDFMVQLKLVLALGAVTYDDHFSLRTSAIQWIYEAQIWISGPKYKARLNIQAMQTNLLLLFAQDYVGVGGDLNWISTGALLRKAMYMGLHRDPSHLPKRTLLAAEMHRRLWNTILEVNVQSSLASGGAPLISTEDFDTAPPGNFDDEQLEMGVENPMPEPDEIKSQTSFAIAFRRTFPQRLAVVQFLNNLASPKAYNETNRFDGDLRKAYQELSRSVRAYTKGSSNFETKLIDSLMQRYFSALHCPYFGASHGTAYAFSRASAVEASLRIWRAACPTLSCDARPAIDDHGAFSRLVACSARFFPSTTVHAAFIIAVELRTQLQENQDSICPAPIRPDLLAVLDGAKAWCLSVIETGETNVKGYLLVSLVVAQVKGMLDGLGEIEIIEELGKAVEDVPRVCLPVLERIVDYQDKTGSLAWPLDDTGLDGLGDWDFMASDTFLDLDGTDSMSWMLNEEFDFGIF